MTDDLDRLAVHQWGDFPGHLYRNGHNSKDFLWVRSCLYCGRPPVLPVVLPELQRQMREEEHWGKESPPMPCVVCGQLHSVSVDCGRQPPDVDPIQYRVVPDAEKLGWAERHRVFGDDPPPATWNPSGRPEVRAWW